MKVFGLLIRIFVLITLIAVGVLIYSTCAGGNIIQRIDKTIPDSTIAPFEVPTRTKVYFAQKAVLNEDKSVTMYGWYERDGDRWVFHEEAVTLPAVLHPGINKR